jgi:hypothetical protein
MSYLSRLYNHRSAQSTEGKEKPFFTGKQNGNDKNKKNNFFQAKLSVNEPGDKYEHEADNVANAVINNKTSKPVVQQKEISSVQRLATSLEDEKLGSNDQRIERDKEDKLKAPVQRSASPEKEKDSSIQKMDAPKKEEEKPMMQKMDALKKEEEKPVQKMDAPKKEEEKPMMQKMGADPEKEKMQKKDDHMMEEEKKKPSAVQTKHNASANIASTQVTAKLTNSEGKGNALPAKTIAEMNTSFGVDFGNVRVHNDNEAANMNQELQAQAFTHGRDIYFNEGKFDPDSSQGKFLLAHELTHVVQQGASERESDVQKKDKEPVKKSLLDQFAEKFPDSVEIIKKSPEAMTLIKEASDAGVQFGGYAEEGPSKDAWPYTIGNTVYVPKGHKADKITAVSDFLFELNNGIHGPGIKAAGKEAAKGSKGSLDAKAYAKKIVEIEVDGMLRLGKVWFEMKKNTPKGEKWDSHDGEFYLSEYQHFKDGKKTKDDIVKDVLARTYKEGKDAGKTIGQYYMDQYNNFANGK